MLLAPRLWSHYRAGGRWVSPHLLRALHWLYSAKLSANHPLPPPPLSPLHGTVRDWITIRPINTRCSKWLPGGRSPVTRLSWRNLQRWTRCRRGTVGGRPLLNNGLNSSPNGNGALCVDSGLRMAVVKPRVGINWSTIHNYPEFCVSDTGHL